MGFTIKKIKLSNLFKSKPAANGEPRVGAEAFSVSFTYFSTGPCSACKCSN